MNKESKFKIGCVQAGADFFNLEGCIKKAEGYIKQAAKEGVKLLVFPETFIPGYPKRLRLWYGRRQ